MKGKNVFILLLVLVVTAGLVAVSLLGVGNVPSTQTSSSDDAVQLEVETDANGEVVTNENGQVNAV